MVNDAVMQVLEYSPSTGADDLRLRTADESYVALTSEQEIALQKAYSLLSFHANLEGKRGFLNRADLRNAIGALTDVDNPSDSMIDSMISEFASNKVDVSLDDFRRMVTSGVLFPSHVGRHWAAVSLAEAETIRRILHLRKRNDSHQIIPLATTELCLRYSPLTGNSLPAGDGGVVFDASWGWQQNGSKATVFEAAVSHSSFRFFDCDMHFSEAALNVLIKTLRARYIAR